MSPAVAPLVVVERGSQTFALARGGGFAGPTQNWGGGAVWKRAPMTGAIIFIGSNGARKKISYKDGQRKKGGACPPHVAGMIHRVLLTRACASSSRYAVTLVT